MTKIRKMLGIVMAAMLCFAFTPMAAFADETPETGKIEINNAIKGETYTIYEVLQLESYNKDAKAYSYKVADAWKAFFDHEDQAKLGISYNKQGYITWNWDDANLTAEQKAEFAKRALAYAKDANNNVSPAAPPKTAETDKVEFTNLPLGYYLVDSSMGTICSLNTSDPTAIINEKNDKPTFDKSVKENSTGDYGDKNDASIGDEVEFMSVITCKPGTEKYVFTDTLSAGLTLVEDSIEVSVKEGILDESDKLVKEQVINGQTFKITFNDKAIAKIAGDRNTDLEDQQITITYKATLNKDAVVAGDGNKNEAKLQYKSDPDGDFREITDETKTFTWQFDVYKYTMNGEARQNLSGAVFKLTTDEAGENSIDFIKDENVYTAMMNGATDTVDQFTSPEGSLTIKGLDEGTYYLHEVTPPAGYNALAAPVKVVITSDNDSGDETKLTYSVDGATTDGFEIPTVLVENNTGSLLPSTGGIGTTVFYIVGGVLVIGAIAYLVVRRRNKATK